MLVYLGLSIYYRDYYKTMYLEWVYTAANLLTWYFTPEQSNVVGILFTKITAPMRNNTTILIISRLTMASRESRTFPAEASCTLIGWSNLFRLRHNEIKVSSRDALWTNINSWCIRRSHTHTRTHVSYCVTLSCVSGNAHMLQSCVLYMPQCESCVSHTAISSI